MIEKIVNVVIKENGFDDLNNKATTLDDNLDNISHSNKNVASSFAESSNAVLENGGAMGLLNDLTGGYAMMVKDAVEASALFITKKRADTIATNATTVATISNNTATQQGIIGKIKDIAVTASSSVAKGVSVVATNVATAAQWLWNAAIMANPLVALVVAIIAAAAAIYKLTSYLIANSKANDAASAATAKMTQELKNQSIAAARNLRTLQEAADYTYELAKANGASTSELRKMKEAAINAEIALNKKNATIAQATFLQERNNLAVAVANGLSDEEIEKKEKLVQAAYKEFQEQNKLLDGSYKERAKLTKDFNIEIASENKAASDKAIEQRKKDRADYLKDLEEKRKAEEEAFKAKQDGYRKDGEDYLKFLEDAKAAREKDQADSLKLFEDAIALESELNEKAAQEQKAAEEKKAQDALEFEQRKNTALASSKENLNNIISGIETSGLAKTKAGQIISKGIALTQIAIDSAVAISKASTLANAEGVAAQLAFPLVPGIGTIARVVSYASTAASVIGNISRAKQLLSSGGSGSSSGSSGGGGSSTPSAPKFNIVGQSGTNQLAQSIGAKQGQPIQAYVVGNEVTSQQALDRNRITTATFN